MIPFVPTPEDEKYIELMEALGDISQELYEMNQKLKMTNKILLFVAREFYQKKSRDDGGQSQGRGSQVSGD